VNALEEDVHAGRYATAFARWHGEFLADLEDVGGEPLRAWVDAERASLHRLLENALDCFLAEATAARHWDDVVHAAQRWAHAHPWQEKAQAQLIEALRGGGRIEEATARHARTVAQLRDEVGVEPSVDFLQLGRELTPARRNGQAQADGADDPMAVLLRAWQSAAGGEGVLAYVESESSAAATRFCEALSHSVSDYSPNVIVLRATTVETPTRPWEIAARLLSAVRTAPGLSGVDDRALATLAHLVPSIRERFPRLPEGSRDDESICKAALQTLSEIAAEIPILIITGDLADADVETRRWLAMLALDLPPGCMLIVATRSNATDEVSTRIAQTPGCMRLRLAAPLETPRSTLRRRLAVGGGVLTVTLSAMVALGISRPPAVVPVLAVGSVAAIDLQPNDPIAGALAVMISTQLAQTAGLEVISRARMQELLARTPGELAAARAARAGVLLEGELYRGDQGGYRLELRHVDVASGRVRAAHTVESPDAIQLAHDAATFVSRSFRLTPPPAPHGVYSVLAQSQFEEGLRTLYRNGDSREAFAHFSSALRQDSAFAMAAHLAALTVSAISADSVAKYMRRAEMLAPGAADPDRLRISAYIANFYNEPRALAIAETLAIRYPNDPAGAIQLATARFGNGDFLGAAKHYERAVELDPLMDGAVPAICYGCDGYSGLVAAYYSADSLSAALRTVRRWTAANAENPSAWQTLATMLDCAGQYREAATARQKLASLRPGEALGDIDQAQSYIRAGQFDTADRLLSAAAESVDSVVATNAYWWQAVSYRYQGRFSEALRAANRYSEFAESRVGRAGALIPRAVVLLESGQAAQATAVLDSLVGFLPDHGRASRNARDRAWWLTQTANAAAATGDTARLARLADSVEAIGALSGYGRDRRLHHHLRGLLQRARGDLAAAEAEFTAALYSSTAGYTRTNVELARLLIERGRPREAAPMVQAALRASLDGSPLYATRTEIHEALGRAWDRAGQRDSAAYHYRSVLNAWRLAEPPLHIRRQSIHRRLAALSTP
jgi:predicted Zn-dependent protease